MDSYPEHEKLKLVADKSQAIGEFLEWAEGRGIVLASWCREDSELLHPFPGRKIGLLAEFFEIDEAGLEQEKRAMLQALRAARGGE